MRRLRTVFENAAWRGDTVFRAIALRRCRLRTPLRPSAWALLGAPLAALGAACVTVTPPPLPTPEPARPTILADAVMPSAGMPLVEWPQDGVFIVPVEVAGTDETFFYDVFIDSDSVTNVGNVIPPELQAPTPSSIDGGIVSVRFQIATPPDPHFCHTVLFLVAHAFDPSSFRLADRVGGDSVTWFYTAGGGPNGCPAYDASAFQDAGASVDSAADAPASTDSP